MANCDLRSIRLIDENGSTIWRVVIEMADWEATNDDSRSEQLQLVVLQHVSTRARDSRSSGPRWPT